MLKTSIEQFVDRYLCQFEVADAGRKYIHDSVWGGIELKDHEHALADTPLLQRLRQLHQTGCVYATYPTARHTRFEHTLGVTHLAGRIVESLKKKYPRDVPDESEQRVRLAALLHDIGHSAFSHSTEEIYGHLDDIKALTQAGAEFADKGAGEVLSYLIVTSDAFRNYFDLLRGKFPSLLVKTVDEFAPLILGRSQNPKKLQFEADIISGPFDADKLDYFPRDGKAAGLSLTLDTDRLLSCLELADIAPTFYIPESEDTETRKTIIVNRGGFNPLQQLLFARATLFSTVYHHHKVRACDCMVKSVFERFSIERIPFKRTESMPQGLGLQSASDYLHVTDLDFFAEAYRHKEDSNIHKLIHNLLYRRLLKRTLIIGAQTIEGFRETEEPDPDMLAGYSDFLSLRDEPEALRNLAIEIADECKVDRSLVWCDIPKEPSFKKAGDALINLASKNEKPRVERLAKFIPTEAWVETYQQYYSQSFVFGPIDRDSRVRIAEVAKKKLHERYGIVLNGHATPHDLRTKDADEPSGAGVA